VHQIHKATFGENSASSADPEPQEVPSASYHVSQVDTPCQLSSGTGPGPICSAMYKVGCDVEHVVLYGQEFLATLLGNVVVVMTSLPFVLLLQKP
jgi:hypothetical protein